VFLTELIQSAEITYIAWVTSRILLEYQGKFFFDKVSILKNVFRVIL